MGGDGAAIRDLSAVELRDRLASGALKAQEVAEAFLQRIEEREGEVRAWAWIDPDFVRHQARHLDMYRSSGRPIGPLHGMPVGLKDVIDTAGIPTENGAALDAGRVPTLDSHVAERLKQAGAIIMGKTVTTELAFLHPSRTRNPHNPAHTPGGSSAGSAAAVADGMVPLAVGTQTGGSVIRPASFCGVTGFKPSFGAIPRRGVLSQSPSLDTVGVFARDAVGAGLLADQLFGHDRDDPATAPAPAPKLMETAQASPPVTPMFAFLRPPGWDDAHPDMREAMLEVVEALGEQVFEIDLPRAFDLAEAERRRINFAEMAHDFYGYASKGWDLLSPEIRAAIEEGNAITARDYLAALDWKKVLLSGLDQVFQRADAILCPAALGPAPEGHGSTGSAIFNGLFTLCGTPAVTIPSLTAGNGLPMGIQLVGAVGNDARLLRTANWLYGHLDALAA